MALYPNRNYKNVGGRIDFFMNETAERGGVVVFSTAGSGVAEDQANAVVTYAVNPSGKKPVGILVCDVVNIDLTRQSLNKYKEEVQIRSKVTIVEEGEVVTNMLVPGITIVAGDTTYLGPSGLLTNVNGGSEATPKVGRFMSRKDENGYAKFNANLPN